MPETCGTNTPREEENKIRERYKLQMPRERSAKEVTLTDMRNMKRAGWDVTNNATYVWLPITWENGMPKICWKDEWKLEDFK